MSIPDFSSYQKLSFLEYAQLLADLKINIKIKLPQTMVDDIPNNSDIFGLLNIKNYINNLRDKNKVILKNGFYEYNFSTTSRE